MATVAELKSALVDEWLALDAVKAVVISSSGTAHDSATGKFTSRPDGGGKKSDGGKGGGATRGSVSWNPKDPTGGGKFGDSKLKHKESSDPVEFDSFGSRGRGKQLGVQVSGLQGKGGLQLKVGGKSLAEHRQAGTLPKALASVTNLIKDYAMIAGQTSSTDSGGKLLPKPRPRREAYRSSIYRDVLSQMVKPYQ